MGLFNKRTLLLGGLAVAAVAGALKNRDKVAGLIGARSSAPEPPSPESATHAPPEATRTPVAEEPAPAPAQANYDIPGPAENTSTPVAAPDPQVRAEGGIDEQAEEAAAAAEAAAIGGTTPEYAGRELGESADEEFHPLAEAGEGEGEGMEQAEALLQDYAEPSAGDPIEGGRQIEDAIEATEHPETPERLEAILGNPPSGETTGLGGQPAVRGEPDPSATSGITSPYASPEAEHAEGEAVEGGTTETGIAEGRGGAEALRRDRPSDDPTPGSSEASPGPPGEVPEGALGGQQASFFAGGKEGTPDETGGGTGDVPEEGAAPGLPDEGAAAAADDAGRETPASEKSSAVWNQPKESGSDDDDSDWQTWSGRAVEP